MAVILIVLGILGALVGSFLNVVVWRVPRGESVVAPPSACPTCGRRIRWFDNVPVVSWIVLRGRCRDCGERIPVRYPLVELGTAGAWVLVGWWFLRDLPIVDAVPMIADLLEAAAFLWLASAGIALALIDLDVRRLPNPIVGTTAVSVVVLLSASAALQGAWSALLLALIGAVALGVLYLILAVAVPGGMGFGDVKLAPVLGFALGWLGLPELLVGAFAPFVLGGVFGIVLLLARRVGRRARIPFGPWMIVGTWIAVFLGDPIAVSYMGIFGLR